MCFPSLLISLDKLIRAHVFHQSHVHTCTRNDFPVGDTATVSLPGRLRLPKYLLVLEHPRTRTDLASAFAMSIPICVQGGG